MTLSPRAIEAAARAIAETRGAIWTRPDHTVSATFDHDAAKAALTAALAVDGLCLVPKEPSEAMLEAAYLEPNSYWHHDTCELPDEWKNEMRSIYRAMIAAASDGDSPREDNKK